MSDPQNNERDILRIVSGTIQPTFSFRDNHRIVDPRGRPCTRRRINLEPLMELGRTEMEPIIHTAGRYYSSTGVLQIGEGHPVSTGVVGVVISRSPDDDFHLFALKAALGAARVNYYFSDPDPVNITHCFTLEPVGVL